MNNKILEVEKLRKFFITARGTVRAGDEVSFSVE